MDLRIVSKEYIVAFTIQLSSWNYLKLNKADIEAISEFIESDGCSGVPEFYHEACVVHDWYFRTHRDFDGSPISFEEANRRFKELIQKKSKFGWFSPMAQWRYLAVALFGEKAWCG